jgi:hypothetical protein
MKFLRQLLLSGLQLFVLINCIFIQSVQAEYYLKITTDNNEIFTGAWLGEYDDSWFYNPLPGPHYRALFQMVNNKPKIHFVPVVNIQNMVYTAKTTPTYNDYYFFNNLQLKSAPLGGWNYISTGNEFHHKREIMSGNYAWDFERRYVFQLNDPADGPNSKYYVWDNTIHSPIQGTVAEIESSAIDYDPIPALVGDLTGRDPGNYVLLHVKGPFYYVFLHLKQNSIPVDLKIGSQVNVGDIIGRVGNSGVSYVPHLHMTMYYRSKELGRYISVPSYFSKAHVMTNAPASHLYPNFSPTRGESIRGVD